MSDVELLESVKKRQARKASATADLKISPAAIVTSVTPLVTDVLVHIVGVERSAARFRL